MPPWIGNASGGTPEDGVARGGYNAPGDPAGKIEWP